MEVGCWMMLVWAACGVRTLADLGLRHDDEDNSLAVAEYFPDADLQHQYQHHERTTK